MRHEHLVVTVESGTKARIEEDLDPGETVEAWVADAIDAKLAAEEAAGKEGAEETGGAETRTSEAIRPDNDETEAGDDEMQASDSDGTTTDESDLTDDDYDEGFEYVDDCAI